MPGAPPPPPSPAPVPRTTSRARRWLRRCGAALVGLIATAVLLEAGLWMLSLFFRPEARTADLAPKPGERRILCIGDSHTWGSHLSADKAYPGQLQSFLDLEPDNPWRVINLGFPGQNSAEVRLRLSRNIAVYKPQIVICWVGANNTWSLAESYLWEHPDSEPPPDVKPPLWQRSRLLGLVRMTIRHVQLYFRHDEEGLEIARGEHTLPGVDGLQRGGGIERTEIVPYVGGHYIPEEEMKRGLYIDLARMKELARENGAQLVLSEYPVSLVETRQSVNRLLAQFARETETPFVPIADGVVPLGEKYGFDTIWFADHHCTALGNYEVARRILVGLMDAKLVDERASWREIPPLDERLSNRGLLFKKREGRALDLVMRGDARDKFRIRIALLLAGPDEPPVEWPTQIGKTGLSATERASYFGQLDSNGDAKIRLQLPETEMAKRLGAPPDASLWGWRLAPIFHPEDAVGKHGELRPGLDVPFDESVAVRPSLGDSVDPSEDDGTR